MPYKDRAENILQCRAYYRQHKDRLKKLSEARRVQRLYGISIDVIKQMAVKQDYKCLMCQKQKPLSVDHCHKTNRVRGLLCRLCNAALGFYEKYQFIAEDYLRRYS